MGSLNIPQQQQQQAATEESIETCLRVIHNTLPKPEIIQGFEYYSADQIKFRASLIHNDTLIEQVYKNGIIKKLRIRYISYPIPNALLNTNSLQRYINTVTGIEISWPIHPKFVFNFISQFKAIKFLKFGSTAFNKFPIEFKEAEMDRNEQCLSLNELIINADPRRYKLQPKDLNFIIKPFELIEMVNIILQFASLYCPNLSTTCFTLPCNTNLRQFLDKMPRIIENGKEDLIYRENYVAFTSKQQIQPLSPPDRVISPAQLPAQEHLRSSKVNQTPRIHRTSSAEIQKGYDSCNNSAEEEEETKQKKKSDKIFYPFYKEPASDKEMSNDSVSESSIDAIFNSSIINKQTIGIPGLEESNRIPENDKEYEPISKIEETDEEDRPLVIDEGSKEEDDDEIQIIDPKDEQELEERWSSSMKRSSSVALVNSRLKINLTVPHARIHSVMKDRPIKTKQPKKKKIKYESYDYINDFNSCFYRPNKKK